MMPFAKQLLQMVPLKIKQDSICTSNVYLHKLPKNIYATLGMIANNPYGSQA